MAVKTTSVGSESDYEFGDLLREWRENRKLSQLDLASRTEVSTRHLSFIETGRSTPSRSLVLRLAAQLDVPLRARNRLLFAAGFAPMYSETSLEQPRLSMVREAVGKVLAGHDPYPALVVDRSWNLIMANSSAQMLLAGAPPELLEPPVNVLRFSLHPQGLAPRIRNLPEWRAHILERLEFQIRETADPGLITLHDELLALSGSGADETDEEIETADVVVPLRLAMGDDELSLFSTVTTFGTPRDVTVQELSIESFFPADAETARILQQRAG